MKTFIDKEGVVRPRLIIGYEQGDIDSPRVTEPTLGKIVGGNMNSIIESEHDSWDTIVNSTYTMARNFEQHKELIRVNFKLLLSEEVLLIVPLLVDKGGRPWFSFGDIRKFQFPNLIAARYSLYVVVKRNTTLHPKLMGSRIRGEIRDLNQWLLKELYYFQLFDKGGKLKSEDSCFYNLRDIKKYLPCKWAGENLADYFLD